MSRLAQSSASMILLAALHLGGSSAPVSGFCRLILALAFFDAAPVELREIELVAIGILESDERAGLAFVDDVALKTNTLGFQLADRVAERTLQLRPIAIDPFRPAGNTEEAG